MIDCFVSSFRINYRNNQHFDVCLQPSSPIVYNLAFVRGTYNIVKEVRHRFHRALCGYGGMVGEGGGGGGGMVESVQKYNPVGECWVLILAFWSEPGFTFRVFGLGYQCVSPRALRSKQKMCRGKNFIKASNTSNANDW